MSVEPTGKELMKLGITREGWIVWAQQRHYNRHSRQNKMNNCSDAWCIRASKHLETLNGKETTS